MIIPRYPISAYIVTVYSQRVDDWADTARRHRKAGGKWHFKISGHHTKEETHDAPFAWCSGLLLRKINNLRTAKQEPDARGGISAAYSAAVVLFNMSTSVSKHCLFPLFSHVSFILLLLTLHVYSLARDIGASLDRGGFHVQYRVPRLFNSNSCTQIDGKWKSNVLVMKHWRDGSFFSEQAIVFLSVYTYVVLF